MDGRDTLVVFCDWHPIKFIQRPLYILHSTNWFVLNRHCISQVCLGSIRDQISSTITLSLVIVCFDDHTIHKIKKIEIYIILFYIINTNTGSLGKEVLLIRIGFLEVICAPLRCKKNKVKIEGARDILAGCINMQVQSPVLCR